MAEQTLAQSSKLAALGEMSAAVSHELNQPLAAMKTYLAGARLLLQRKRPEEALSSFQRIDDLIDRMGAITRQLKSYARKGGEAFEPVDIRACVSSALSMMEPQLRPASVKITRAMPRGPVMVLADRMRLEQVIINLLRNALDATKDRADPQIDILVTAGETVGADGARQRPRHHRSGKPVRAFLHHQGARRGRRAWPCHFVWHRERPWGAADRAQRAERPGAVFEMQLADPGRQEPKQRSRMTWPVR